MNYQDRERARNELYHYGVKGMKWKDRKRKKMIKEIGDSWKNAPKDMFNRMEDSRKAGAKANKKRIRNEKINSVKNTIASKKTFNKAKKSLQNYADKQTMQDFATKNKIRKKKVSNAVNKAKSGARKAKSKVKKVISKYRK